MILNQLIRFSRTVRFALPAILALILQIQFFGGAQPPPWPDEALFSNPAHELAEGRGFRTMVLDGLVPGMEEATLWNSPLYMVMLSGVYSMTGESLEAGRALSLIIAILILLLITGFLQSLQVDPPVALIAPLLVALDPAFVRGANVIRMDGLCLLFCLLALQYSFRAFHFKKDHYSFLAGAFLGLGAMSHPAALYGVALVAIFHLFRWRGLVFAFCGVLLATSPWLAYIAAHPDIFEVQFVSQLVRKSGLLTLWGGPTGGIFVVFTSQFGGGALSMLMVSLLVAVVSGQVLWLWFQMWDAGLPLESALELLRSNRFFLLSLSWPLVTAFCMLSVEGWYAMHSFPYLVLSMTAFFALPFKETMLRQRAGWILRSFGLGILLIGAVNASRHGSRDSSEIVSNALNRMVQKTGECKSIYVRMIPDPYFAIRSVRPDTAYYEFVPAKLTFPEGVIDPEQKYETIDCFLLEGSGLQNGKADEYIARNSGDFERIPMAFSGPAASGSLYIRKPPSQ
ncbi:MAG: hypothetical protein CMN76_02850 [Spirochaetaceae bacterium]|nr:hypothetical protein [Spirochaetaceae bacterium]|tara:strand:- start:2278 stop:3810 length:1533 start_codon:yes stop_codon:yes gene_type:complete